MKILLSSPEPASVVVFDREGSETLARMVLEGIPHAILETRRERYFLGLSVILGMLARIHLLFEARPFAWHLMPRFWLGQLYRVYQLSCLAVMRPKVVLTFIDNSYNFQWLSRRFSGSKFFAIQNGVRSEYDVSSWLPPPPHPASTISMPEMFCFGDYERDLYAKFGHRVDRFHPVGSLKAAFYRRSAGPPGRKVRFDICLVSQWWGEIRTDVSPGSEIKASQAKLYELLREYVKETDASICVATRTGSSAEVGFFRDYFGGAAQVVANDPKKMSTYAAMDESEVVIANDSTAAREAFGWGSKVLFCNYSEDRNYDCPVSGPWSTSASDYPAFRKTLTALRRMPSDAYAQASTGPANYIMRFDKNSFAHETIRVKILDSLGGA